MIAPQSAHDQTEARATGSVLAIALALGNLAGGRWLGPDWAPEWILVIFGLFTAGLWLAEGGESKNRSEP